MKIKKGDTVVIITGKDKGKTGKVIATSPVRKKLIVENVNFKTKFVKKGQGKPGQQVKIEKALDVSNVMLIDEKTKKRTRIGYTILDSGKKARVSKKSNAIID